MNSSEPSEDSRGEIDDLYLPLVGSEPSSLPTLSCTPTIRGGQSFFLVDVGEHDLVDEEEERQRKIEEQAERWKDVKNSTWLMIEIAAVRGILRGYRWVYPLMLFVTLVGRDMCSIFGGYVLGLFSRSVLQNSAEQLGRSVFLGVLVSLTTIFFSTTCTFSRDACTLQWRASLAKYTNIFYLSGKGGAHMHYVREVSTSDQRVSTDIITLTREMANFMYSCVTAPFVLFIDFYLIWNMFGPLLVISLAVFFILCIVLIVTVLLGLAPKLYYAAQAEGYFRSSVANACLYSESIAFCDPTALWVGEKTRIERQLKEALLAQWKVILRKILLTVTGAGSLAFGYNWAYAVVAMVLIFSPHYHDNEDITPESRAELFTSGTYYCVFVLNQLAKIAVACESLSYIKGTSGRVAELLFATEFRNTRHTLPRWYQLAYWLGAEDDVTTARKAEEDNCSWIKQSVWKSVPSVGSIKTIVSMHNVNIYCKNQERFLLKNFTFELTKGTNVLISGPSGCGKTSLLHRLAGIDGKSFSGVSWNIPLASKYVIFSPQAPYCFQGTMKDNVTYPLEGRALVGDDKTDSIIWNEAAHNALVAVDLYRLIDPEYGLETEANWPTFISTGEAQQLSISRIFFNRPMLAILDESTSGLEEQLQARIYSRLCSIGVTVLTVGHRESLEMFHDVKISMGVDMYGSYKIRHLERDGISNRPYLAKAVSSI